MKNTTVITLVLYATFACLVARCDEPPILTQGSEVKSGKESLFLSELGLSENSLDWGNAINQIKISALCLPVKDPKLTGQVELVVVIRNDSGSPLIIPLINDFPEIEIDDVSTSPPTWLYEHRAGLGGMFDTRGLKLETGKMITFTNRYRISDITQASPPMILRVLFRSPGGVKIPEASRGLILESKQFRFP